MNEFMKMTTKISVMGNMLDVTIYEYVDKEEHDAKILYTGNLLKEYFIYTDNEILKKCNKIFLYKQGMYAIIKIEIGVTAHKVVSLDELQNYPDSPKLQGSFYLRLLFLSIIVKSN